MIATSAESMQVRPLEVYELPLCLPFGHAFFRELQLPGTFNEDVFLKNWTTYLTSYGARIFSLWEGETLIGGIGGMLAPDVFTGEKICQEFFWFIAPEYRHRTGALRLFKRFKRWGKESGASRLRMVRMLSADQSEKLTTGDDALDALYRTVGGRPIEIAYDIPL